VEERRVKAAVFDLDGTLIDSAPDLHAAGNRVLAAEGLAPVSLDQARSFVGNGAPVFVERLIRASGRAPDAALQARMLAAFLELYESAVHLTRPYPGAVAALEALRRDGWRLGLCTNKPLAPALAVLEHLDMAHLFDAVTGGDSLPQSKPDPAPLRHTLALLGAPGRAVYVGDSEVDAATAHAAALPFALYSPGYRKSPVADLRPAFAFDDYSTLPGWLERDPG
jgi:phosphoglycolate phosphatase